MKPGKITETQCKRSVLKYLPKEKGKVLQGAGIGLDSRVLNVSEDAALGTATASCTLPTLYPAEYAWAKAWNKLLVSGIRPYACEVQMFLPARGSEDRIKEITQQILGLCEAREVQYIGGHTELVADLTAPLITVTMMGTAGEIPARKPHRIAPEMLLWQLQPLGLEATMMLFRDHVDALKERYAASYLKRYEAIEEQLFLPASLADSKAVDVIYAHALSTGGILDGLWQLGEGAKMGLSVDILKLEILQETVEVCEFFEVNPYLAMSGGTALVVTTKEVTSLPEDWQGVLIGQITDTNDRIVCNGAEERYLTPPKTDELYRIYLNR